MPTGGDDLNIPDSAKNEGPLISWYDIANIPKPLKRFVVAPTSFILGALLSQVTDGLEAIVESFIKAILAVFDSLAYVPKAGANILGDAGGVAGGMVVDAISTSLETMQGVAAAAGPAAPLVGAALVAGFIIAGAYAARFAYTLAVDTINPL